MQVICPTCLILSATGEHNICGFSQQLTIEQILRAFASAAMAINIVLAAS
jgi:hypothetical protein